MSQYTFEVFSIDHIVSIIVILFLFIIFLRYNDKIGIEDNSKTFLIILSILMIFLDLSEDIVRVFTGYYSINKDLPLQLCSIGVYLAAFNLQYRNQTIFNFILINKND